MKGTVVGQITQIGEVQVFGSEEKPFLKRELILKTVEEYPNFYKVEFTQDKTNLLDGFEKGQVVKIKCNLKGREYENQETGKYDVFMGLNAWAIELN